MSPFGPCAPVAPLKFPLLVQVVDAVFSYTSPLEVFNAQSPIAPNDVAGAPVTLCILDPATPAGPCAPIAPAGP